MAYAAQACAFCLIHVSMQILQPLPWEEGFAGQRQRKTLKRNPEEIRDWGWHIISAVWWVYWVAHDVLPQGFWVLTIRALFHTLKYGLCHGLAKCSTQVLLCKTVCLAENHFLHDLLSGCTRGRRGSCFNWNKSQVSSSSQSTLGDCSNWSGFLEICFAFFFALDG